MVMVMAVGLARLSGDTAGARPPPRSFAPEEKVK
jgi:hypothetical protein